MYLFFLGSLIGYAGNGDELRGKVLAHLISLTVQLKYLLVERFTWLLHVIQYVRFSLMFKSTIYLKNKINQFDR